MNWYRNALFIPNAPEGLGDPFVFRHNGHYYLYPSTPHHENGVHVWVSEDMVNWRDGGWVLRDACMQNTYAPEVCYFNGRFLLVGSPMGQDHYLYVSTSPLGPLTRITDNFGRVIDGSIFVDDDAQLYFSHAEYPCIYGYRMDSDGKLSDETPLRETGMGHWTEGSGIFKRQGTYYITMTGNHLLSRGYRIDYATSSVSPLGPYEQPEEKTILVNTDPVDGSLGHSSNVIGPDLDSYWIFYHSFEKDDRGRHVKRHVRLDRMLFNGKKLLVSGPTNQPVPAPRRPDAYGWADDPAWDASFIRSADGVFLTEPAGKRFTAEINVIPGFEARICFAYRDGQNYDYISLLDGRLEVGSVEQGTTRQGFARDLFSQFDSQALHTIRLEADGAELHVYLDHMLQSHSLAWSGKPGLIGVLKAKVSSYLALTHLVAQQGDREHFHPIPGAIEAVLYLPPDQEAVSAEQSNHPGRFPAPDGLETVAAADGAFDVILNESDKVTYRLNVKEAGLYRIQTVMAVEQGAELEIEFAGGSRMVSIAPGGRLERSELLCIALPEGLQTLQITNKGPAIRLSKLDIFPRAQSLAGSWSGLDLCHAVKQVEGQGSDGFLARMEGLQMDREVQALGILGSRYQTDGHIEADVIIRGDGAPESAGLFLRLSENSFHPDQIKVGHRGYFVGFDMENVSIQRLNFGSKLLAQTPCLLERERKYRMKAAIEGNTIKVWLDGREILRADDPVSLPYGQLAVGSFGLRITVERAEVGAL